MEEWKEYKLEDIAEILTGPFGSQLHNEDYTNIGTPIVTVEHLGNRRFSRQNLPLISDYDKKRLSKYTLQNGDIVFSRVGSVDRCSYVTSTENDWLFSGRCLRVRCNNNCHSLFIYYYFCNVPVKQYIKSIAVGATMPSINTRIMSEIPILLPKFEKQKHIADILSSLDDKIELNRRINENLEQQAQALFKSWFVDFEPFKDGKFVDSELGMIPEGWRVGVLADIANITMGQSPKGTSYNEIGDGISFYQGRAEFGNRFPSVRLFTTEPSRYAEPYSVLLSVRAPVGDINIAVERCCIGRGLASILSKNKHQSFVLYTMFFLKKELDKFNSEGTVFGSINRSSLENLKIIIPPVDIIDKFENLTSKIDVMLLNLFQETTSLAQLRDTLLPRLMSGELAITDVNDRSI